MTRHDLGLGGKAQTALIGGLGLIFALPLIILGERLASWIAIHPAAVLLPLLLGYNLGLRKVLRLDGEFRT